MKEIITNETHKKVHFIGSGYEAVKTIVVKAKTNREALDMADGIYNANKWNFHYCEIEVAKCL